MLLKRIIPSLLYSQNGLYKTKQFKEKKYVGDVLNAVRLFNDLGADEIIVLDIDATKEQKGPNFDLVKKLSSECFMPLTYGGGIKSLSDAEKILRLGVEKISVNDAILNDPPFLNQLSKEFGSSTIVASIDVKKRFFKKNIYSYKKNKMHSNNVSEYIKNLELRGAGEIFLTSVDNEGMQAGFDIDLIKDIASSINIPLIAHGGCRSFNDIKSAFKAGASATSCGSKFIYSGPHNAVLINYISEEEYNILNFNMDS